MIPTEEEYQAALVLYANERARRCLVRIYHLNRFYEETDHLVDSAKHWAVDFALNEGEAEVVVEAIKESNWSRAELSSDNSNYSCDFDDYENPWL